MKKSQFVNLKKLQLYAWVYVGVISQKNRWCCH